MDRAEEKNIGIIKKAKELLPDGGYSEKELNLAFSMFINGYRQAEKDLALTAEDVGVLVNIIQEDYNNRGSVIGMFKRVAKRFNESRINKQKES